MLNRLLSLAVSFLVASCAAAPIGASPFDHADLGKCFKNTDAFLESAIGGTALDDPNISSTSKGSWTWIVDQTASKNYTWYLLERSGEQICLRIFVPAASNVQLQGRGKTARAEAFIAPEIDFSPKLVELQPTASGEKFRAVRCSLLEKPTGGHLAKRKPIPCEQVLD